jgi:hypothetical protein
MNPAETPWPPQEPVHTAPVPVAPPAEFPWRKNPRLAVLLSLFPGLGNVYNGLYGRGIIFFLIAVSLIGITSRGHDLVGMAVGFFWIFNLIDAYRQATLINYGYAQDLGLTDMPKVPKASQGGLLAGILLTVIGLFAVLDRFFIINLDWIFDLWPLALVAIGLWLIWSSVKDRVRARLTRDGEV